MTATTKSNEVQTFLKHRLATLTKQDESIITPDVVLVDIGLQSIDAVLLCGEVEDQFAIELDPATIFDHDTLGSFAADVVSRIEAA